MGSGPNAEWSRRGGVFAGPAGIACSGFGKSFVQASSVTIRPSRRARRCLNSMSMARRTALEAPAW
jgi:hypothetical protein